MNQYVSIFLYPFIIVIVGLIIAIPILRKRGQQSIRDLGPESHLKKSGTPTMGGLIIVLTIVVVYTIIHFLLMKEPFITWLMIMMPLITYATIGIIDDYLKVVQKDNKGLSPTCKLFFQIIWGAMYFYLCLSNNHSTIIKFGKFNIDLTWMYGCFTLFMMVATSNAVNLTDGLDGLAGGILLLVFGSVAIISYMQNSSLFVFLLVVIATILAFLCFNFHPAKIFMGDVGSLALGATLANVFILLKIEVLLLVFGFVIILETLSDILQVWYFKKTSGKRLFRMAPLHHHFELSGYKEIQVDILFWLLQLLFCLLGIYLYYHYFI